MNTTLKKILLVGDKFSPEMHLKQPRFTCRAWGKFTNNKKIIKTFKETRDST